MKVVGLDVSLTNTGVAVLSGEDTNVFRISSKPCPDDIQPRVERLLGMVRQLPLVTEGDLVVVEQPAFSKTTGKHHDRSGLWWLMVEDLTARGADVVEVAPSVLKKYVVGKGNASKSEMQGTMIRRMLPLAPSLVLHDDNEVDAFGLAAMGARHLGHPVDGDLPRPNLAVMGSVRWP